MSSCAFDTCSCFGNSWNYLALGFHNSQPCRLPIILTATMNANSCGLQVRGPRGSPRQQSLASLGGLGFSLAPLCCVILAPSEYLHSSQPLSSSWVPTPEAWTQHPPLIHGGKHESHLLLEKYCLLFATISVVNSLWLVYQAHSLLMLCSLPRLWSSPSVFNHE